MKEVKKIFCVIGYPLEHSLSPVLFNWIFQKLNLPYIYLKVSFDKDKLPNFIASITVMPIKGISVTIPYKELILPYLDFFDESVKKIKATNTLLIKNNETSGYNTDWIGFIEPIKKENNIKSAFILGSGGSARACIVGLKNLKLKEIYISSRNKTTMNTLKNEFNIKTIDWEHRHAIKADLLVNTTPLGMKGYEDSSPIEKKYVKQYKYVYDVVYNPIKTRLIQFAEEAGCKTIYGIKMFVCQAVEQLKIWTGRKFDIAEAEKFLIKKIRD